MTYSEFAKALLVLSLALVLPTLFCLAGACLPNKRSIRVGFAIATVILAGLAIGAYWVAWSIAAGI